MEHDSEKLSLYHDPMGRSRLCLSQQTRKRVRA
jgi:hypothetical protein